MSAAKSQGYVRLVAIAMLLLSAALLAAMPLYAASPATFTSTHGYTLTLPGSGWTRLTNTSGAPKGTEFVSTFAVNNVIVSDIVVTAKTVTPDFTVPVIAATWKQHELSMMPSYSEQSREVTKVDGVSAFHVVSSVKKGTLTGIDDHYLIVRNGMLYTFVYSAESRQFAAQEPAFEAMVHSIQWK